VIEMDRQGLRERIELVRPAEPTGFATALFRVVREPKDEAERTREHSRATRRFTATGARRVRRRGAEPCG
jgi:hypothetical protein